MNVVRTFSFFGKIIIGLTLCHVLGGLPVLAQRDYTGSGKPKPVPTAPKPTPPKPTPKPKPKPTGSKPKPAVSGNCKNEPRVLPPAQTLPTEAFTFETAMVDEMGVVTREPAQGKLYRETLADGVTLELVEVAGGSFCLGTVAEEDSNDNESPRIAARVPGFYCGRFEVTQAQWKAVAAYPKVKIDLPANPSEIKGDTLPVDNVSWDESVEFCARLSRKTGRIYRLPSETEWEYACRAGRTTPFGFGMTLSQTVENYDSSLPFGDEPTVPAFKRAIPVGSGLPNPFGLSDMHGNVREWCLDEYCKHFTGSHAVGAPTRNLRLAEDRLQHVIRGGSWAVSPNICRAAVRDHDLFSAKNSLLGFRVVVSDRAYGADDPGEDDGGDAGDDPPKK